MQAYSRAITGKHVPSPTNSPTHSNKKPKLRSTPQSDQKPKHASIPNSVTERSDGTLQNSADANTITNAVTTCNGDSTLNSVTDDSTLEMMIPNAAIGEQKASTEVTATLESMKKSMVPPYNMNNLPHVTPHDGYRSIITQHHLNNIQRIIFFTNENKNNDPLNQLRAEVQQLQHLLQESERKKEEEELLTWKEKYKEAKQEARDAKIHHNHNNHDKTTFVCNIQ